MLSAFPYHSPSSSSFPCGPHLARCGLLGRVVIARREGAHVDLQLSAGGRRFGAHKIVLSAGSLYLRTRLCGEWADGSSEMALDDDGISAASLEAVLEFIYTGACEVAHGDGTALFSRLAEGRPPRLEEVLEAIDNFEAALEIEPDYADAYCNLGAVRYNQGQRAEARRAFEACLSREADHVEANFNLSNVLEEEGDDRGALAHYRRALAADPLYPDLHINLALLYEKLARERHACDHWRRYLQLDPRGSWAEVARSRLKRDSGKA